MPKKRTRPKPETDFYSFPESRNAVPLPRRVDFLPDSALRPSNRLYGPETEEDYYLRLVSELQGFDLGMAMDSIADLDIVNSLERMDRSKTNTAALAYKLATSNDASVRRTADRILAANGLLQSVLCEDRPRHPQPTLGSADGSGRR